MFDRPAVHIEAMAIRGYRPYIKPVTLAGYSMPRTRPSPRLAQLVTVNPNIKVEVNTGLEQYLFPAGLMAGGGAMFLLGTAVPSWAKPWTTIAGLALVGSGVGVLLYRGLKKAAAAAAAAPPRPSGGVTVDDAPSFQPPPETAFRTLQLSVVTPQSGQTIASEGGFLGFGSKKIPVHLRMFNPSESEVTFNLDFSWDEFPAFTGYDRGQYRGVESFQVTLGPNEQKNQTFNLPIQTDVTWTQMQVALAMHARRTPQENQQLLSNITFTVV